MNSENLIKELQKDVDRRPRWSPLWEDHGDYFISNEHTKPDSPLYRVTLYLDVFQTKDKLLILADLGDVGFYPYAANALWLWGRYDGNHKNLEIRPKNTVREITRDDYGPYIDEVAQNCKFEADKQQ